MRIFAPDYYKDFKCIAGECKHSCCIGWEIDIDKNSLEFYKTVGGKFGKMLAENIAFEDENSHFILKNDDCCPFLNRDNLCDIIINLGENKLCDICNDHPRFRNFYSEFMEIGVGMCCEAAARLILNNKSKVSVCELSDENNKLLASDEEEIFLQFRDRVFEILQNREIPIEKRVYELLSRCDIKDECLQFSNWFDIYLTLECLDENWFEILKHTKNKRTKSKIPKELEIPLEQLLIYFVYRHLSDGIYDGLLRERIGFVILSFNVITEIFSVMLQGDDFKFTGIELLAEIARMYSSEIEYCEENINEILRLLSQKL